MRFYQILGFRRNIPAAEIQAAYYAACQSGEINNPEKYHAFSVLNNEASRRVYDAFNQRFSQQAASDDFDLTRTFLDAVVADPKYAAYLFENEIELPIDEGAFIAALKAYPKFDDRTVNNFKAILYAEFCDPQSRMHLFDCVRMVYPILIYEDKYLDLLIKANKFHDFFEKNKKLTIILCISHLRTDLLQLINYKPVFSEISTTDLYSSWLFGASITVSHRIGQVVEMHKLLSEKSLSVNILVEFLKHAISTEHKSPGMIEVFRIMLPKINNDNAMEDMMTHALNHLLHNGDNFFRAMRICVDEENSKHQVTRVLSRFNRDVLLGQSIQSGGLTVLLKHLGLHQPQHQLNIAPRLF